MPRYPLSVSSESLRGMIERVVCHVPENGYTVFRVRAMGMRTLATVVGRTPIGAPGECIHAVGRWADDYVHGRQFRADTIEILPPDSVFGIETYLKSGTVTGIGAVYARKMIDHFGAELLHIIEHEPERLLEIEGIGQKRADSIIAAWRTEQHMRHIMVFLHTHGLSSTYAVRIYKRYGAESIKVITENPYRLALDIPGFGFMQADRLAQQLNIGLHHNSRIKAAFRHLLNEAAAHDGHCGLPEEILLKKALKLLDLPVHALERIVLDEIASGYLIADHSEHQTLIFLGWLYASEQGIARQLRALQLGVSQKTAPLNANENHAVFTFKQKTDMTLSPSQQTALEVMLANKVCILTGGPGVGKTTLIRALIDSPQMRSRNIVLCAPTGRAAKRLSETTGCTAQTIHRLLGAIPGSGKFQYGAGKPLTLDVLIIDECSMVDVSLMFALLNAVPNHASVIFVGDNDQLPSVGPGRVFGDMIDSGRIVTVHLTDIFRQAQKSMIIQTAHQIRQGIEPFFPEKGSDSDCYFIQAESAESICDKLLTLVTQRIPARFGFDPIRDIQILTPMNRGMLGMKALNQWLQPRINPGQAGIERQDERFFIGDKVMQMENDYDKSVFNGDIGYIISIQNDTKIVQVDFDGKIVDYAFHELNALHLAYAATVHKSQGSEYPVVIVLLHTQHYPLLQRNLVYTALTRGRRLAVFLGQKRAFRMALSQTRLPKRHTRLRTFLIESG